MSGHTPGRRHLSVSTMVMDTEAWAALNDGKHELTIIREDWDGMTGEVVACVWDDDGEREVLTALQFANSGETAAELERAREDIAELATALKVAEELLSDCPDDDGTLAPIRKEINDILAKHARAETSHG